MTDSDKKRLKRRLRIVNALALVNDVCIRFHSLLLAIHESIHYGGRLGVDEFFLADANEDELAVAAEVRDEFSRLTSFVRGDIAAEQSEYPN